MKEYLQKIDQKQLRLLLLLVIVIILFVGYQFGYVKYNGKTVTLEEENEVLTTRYNELSDMVAMESVYDTNTETYNTEIEAIKAKYGAGNTPEKSIRFLIDLSEEADVMIPTVSFSTDENIFSSTALPSKDSAGIYAYRNLLSFTYKTTYQGFKDMMTFMNTNSERMTVDSVTAAFDSETGNLSGTLILNQYAITGTENTYQKPEFDHIDIGTSNIFGTIEIPIGSETDQN